MRSTLGPAGSGPERPETLASAGVARRAVFPGSFDPLTVAHVAVVEAVIDQLDVDSVDLVLSEVALAKEHRRGPTAHERAEAVRRIVGGLDHVGVRVTQDQLLADIAEGYDVLVMGADKWHQLLDVAFYDDLAARDAALARLPEVAVAPRHGSELPSRGEAPVAVTVHVLDVDDEHHGVSSTGVREGRHDWRAGPA